MFHVPNKYRLKDHPQLGSTDDYGNNGFFLVPYPLKGSELQYRCMVSDGMGWEHVSVSLALPGRNALRCPTWEEMCYVKDLFWDKEDCVIQFHPAKSEYVNTHPFVLHLWRPIGVTLPIPDKIMVG